MINFVQNKRLRHHLSLLFSGIFAFHFLLLHGGWSGFVLCIGSDGHVAVEQNAGDATCSENGILPHQAEVAVHALDCADLAKQHCGDCRDIALMFDCQNEPARQPQKPVEVHPVQPINLSVYWGKFCGIEFCHPKTASDVSPRSHLHLVSLQSTVLLI